MQKRWNTIEIIKWTESYFAKHGIPNPRLDAEILLAHTLGVKRIDLYLNFDKPLSQSKLLSFKQLIKRRAKREPLQYITGQQEFWSMNVTVTPDVLIPRPESELIIEEALNIFKRDDRIKILELGTGSGAISMALASEFCNATITATDISANALEVAKLNLDRFKNRVTLVKANLFEGLNSYRFNLIVSNPPYVSNSDIKRLQPEVGLYEPKVALLAGESGIEFHKKIIDRAHNHLEQGGWIILEMGINHAAKLLDLFTGSGRYSAIETIKDLSGVDRIIKAKLKG